MSMNKIAVLLLSIALWIPHPSYAADAAETEEASTDEAKPKLDPREIVYRVNLGRNDDVKYLLAKGISPDLKDEKGTPIVSLASVRKDEEGMKILQTLIDAGADVNAKDGNGQSALFYASKKGNEDVVKFLLEHKINYYSVDSNGDIARTIAYRAGYNNIVKIMDNFVKAETAKVTEQYRELSKALEDRYKAQDEATKDSQKKAADEATKTALERNRQITEQQNAAAAKANQEAEDLGKKRASEAFTQARYDLAFHACGFQYWSFCKDAKQTSDISEELRDNAIASHAQKVTELRQELSKTYRVQKKSVDGIIGNAQHSVFNQLMAMPSKTWRFEHGVCKMEDMVKRCDYIAKYPGTLTDKPVKKGAAAGRGARRVRR